MDSIYVEDDLRQHPRTTAVLARNPRASVIPCTTYGEVFNPHAQDFRLQKKNPALIVAQKRGSLVLPTPAGYGIGASRNFYFSHLLNCLYDCRYCFLQGMFRSANYVWFVNYEDFASAIDAEVAAADAAGDDVAFFSGYDCDSLAMEAVTGFAADFVERFEKWPSATLELRTKSVGIRCLLERSPLPNVVVAFSLTPTAVAAAVEHRAPSVERRLAAMKALAEAGWRIGLRLDPLIDYADFEAGYRGLMEQIFSAVPESAVHSATFGPLRFPREMLSRIEKMYPLEPMFAVPFEVREDGLASYPARREQALRGVVGSLLIDRLGAGRVFDCVAPMEPESAVNGPSLEGQ